MFRDLKRADLKQMKLGTDKSKILDGISLYKDNLVLLGFEDIDMVDLVAVLKMHYTHDSHVSFMQSTCNLINDGNHDYAHDAIFSEELKNNVLINLIKEGIEWTMANLNLPCNFLKTLIDVDDPKAEITVDAAIAKLKRL